VRREIDYGREAGLRSQFEYASSTALVGQVGTNLARSQGQRFVETQRRSEWTSFYGESQTEHASSADLRNRAYAIDLTCLAWPSVAVVLKDVPQGNPVP